MSVPSAIPIPHTDPFAQSSLLLIGGPRSIEARSRTLLKYDDADDLYREAIERLRRTQLRPELARAHLDYGECPRHAAGFAAIITFGLVLMVLNLAK